jgi:hypothetical protein
MTETAQKSSDFVHDLRQAVKQNPLSATLIGMGLVWLFAPRPETVARVAPLRGVADAAQHAWKGASSGLQSTSGGIQAGLSTVSDAVGDRASSASNALGEAASRVATGIADRTGEIPERAQNAFEEAQTNFSEMFRRQPLVLGAVGLAVGAAIAASLPTTEVESEYLGETSGLIKGKISELAGEKAEQATDVGKRVLEAVIDEAQQQGLTSEGLRSTANEISEKVTRIGSVVRPMSEPTNRSQDTQPRTGGGPGFANVPSESSANQSPQTRPRQ